MKIKEQVLSREQMAHLAELGIDTSDASMCWLRYDADGDVRHFVAVNDEMCYEMSCAEPCPTYTIGDIIEKLPKDIEGSCLDINYIYSEIVYKDILHYDFEGVGLLNTLYAVLCWVAENHKELIK